MMRLTRQSGRHLPMFTLRCNPREEEICVCSRMWSACYAACDPLLWSLEFIRYLLGRNAAAVQFPARCLPRAASYKARILGRHLL